MNNNKFGYSRHKYQQLRTVLLTSLCWVFIDAFLIIYLTECDCSKYIVPCDHQQQQQQKPSEIVNNEDVLLRNREKFHQSKVNSYQFSSKNERHGFLDKLKVWFKEKPSDTTNPPHWHGEQGRGVVIPKNLKAEADKRFKENQFNIVASDLIALNRTVPDQRSQV